MWSRCVMADRREFDRKTKVAIIRRATRDGVVYCEECGLPTSRFHIDHTDPDALQIDKSRKLTADDGKLLCAGSRETCHGRKTAERDIPNIAEAKRREAADLGAEKPHKAPIQQPPKAPKSSAKLDSIRALGGTGLSRQGFEPIGDVAARVMAKLKRAAE